jgi:hypothetical protein
MCSRCEGMGCIPHRVYKGEEIESGMIVTPEDDWVFQKCDVCNGTGRRPWYKWIWRIPGFIRMRLKLK